MFESGQDTQQLNGRRTKPSVGEDSRPWLRTRTVTLTRSPTTKRQTRARRQEEQTLHKEKTIAHHNGGTNPPTIRKSAHAESWNAEFALRVGSSARRSPVPAVIRRQRSSPFNAPLIRGSSRVGKFSACSGMVGVESVGHPVNQSNFTAARQRPATQSKLGLVGVEGRDEVMGHHGLR